MKIAIIGTGIAGNAAAWVLNQSHDITVYEKEPRPGGHAHTVDIEIEGQTITVDTGFIVMNHRNYPHFKKLLEHINVPTEPSDMSFSVSRDQGKFEWSSKGLKGLFASSKNLINPTFYRMLFDVVKFYAIAEKDLEKGVLQELSLGDYLKKRNFSDAFRDNFLLPMGAAIWSTPNEAMLEFPAQSFMTFFKNHGLSSTNKPKWRTVTGGSRSYVQRLTQDYADKIKYESEVISVAPKNNQVEVKTSDGKSALYDHVIMACHSDQSAKLLQDTDLKSKDILANIRYKENSVYLHSDERFMPKNKNAWTSWNYLHDQSDDTIALTYWMNLLQNIESAKPVLVTLNPDNEPDPSLTYGTYSYTHPQFNAAAIKAQSDIQNEQGVSNIWYCGAWMKYGFHEDGLASTVSVLEKIGIAIPWASDQS